VADTQLKAVHTQAATVQGDRITSLQQQISALSEAKERQVTEQARLQRQLEQVVIRDRH
jgi:hypothetical protein